VKHFLLAFLFGLLTIATQSQTCLAHLIYIYVPAGQNEVRAVFGHGAYPDGSSSLDRLEKIELKSRDKAGTVRPLALSKADGHYYAAEWDGFQPIVVFGVASVGVTQRGEQPPQLTTYYPKTVIGDPFAESARVGEALKLEILPVLEEGGVRFQVVFMGKPLENASVEVTTSEDKFGAETIKTNAEGMTPVYLGSGRFSVSALGLVPSSGEFEGQPYENIRHIASLVIDMP